MNWYEGDISSAIQKAQMEKKIFLVYIEDDSDQSNRMQETWDTEKVSSCCSEAACVAVRLQSKSQQGIQFASCYPLLFVPCTYLINQAGVPTDVIPGYLSPDEFCNKISKTIQNTLSNQTTTQLTNEDTPTANQPVTPEDNPYADMPALEESINTSSNMQNSAEFQERVTRAEQLIIDRQRQKDKKEEENTKLRERNRRRDGQEIAKSKRDRADQQARDWAADLAKNKAEEKAAREAVREQIRRDQAEKSVKFEAEKEENLKQRETRRAKAEQQKIEIPASERTSTRLQFKLPDGSNSTKQFPAEDKLQNILDFVLQDVCPRYKNVKLATLYPRHEFRDDEMNSSLRDLNLVPNAALIVIPSQQSTAAGNNSGIVELLMFILAPIIAVVIWLKSLFVGNSNSNTEKTTKQFQSQPIASTSRRKSPSTDQSHDGNAYRKEGNVYKFKQDDEDDEDNNTWNGNSTQQM